MINTVLQVNTLNHNMRLDRFIKLNFRGINQALIEKFIRQKKITIANTTAKSSYRVQTGDKVLIKAIDFANKLIAEKKYSTEIINLAKAIKSELLIYEDAELLIINKPYGLATQGGSKIRMSVDDALSFINLDQGTSLKLTHRLDKTTSGLLIIAKNRLAAAKITAAFKAKLIIKKYYAIVYNKPDKTKGQITSNIIKADSNKLQKMIESEDNGKLAITNYTLVRNFKINDRDVSLMMFEPVTGRMHQIRIHAATLNCPIVGDTKYGDKFEDGYLYLHAAVIKISKTVLNQEYTFKAPLPDIWYINFRASIFSDISDIA